MDTDKHDVMEYDAATGQISYRAFTAEEAADNAAREAEVVELEDSVPPVEVLAEETQA